MCLRHIYLVTLTILLVILNQTVCYRRYSFDVVSVEMLYEKLGHSMEKVHECIISGIPILEDTQRGEVRKIEITNHTNVVLPGGMIANFSRLEKINLNGNSITVIKTAAFSNLPSLKYVNLSDNKIVTMEFGIFADVLKLLQLDLAKNALFHFEQAWLGYVPTLEWLNMEHNSLKTITTAAFSNFENLRYLNLGHNQIQHIDEDAFYPLEKLEILDLSYNRINKLHDDLFLSVPELHVLNLFYNELSYISDPVLQQLSQLREFITLMNPWQLGCYKKIHVWGENKSVRIDKNKYFKCANTDDVNNMPKFIVSDEKECNANVKRNFCDELYSAISDFKCYFDYDMYIHL